MSEDDFATGQASVEERQGWTEMLPAEPTPERDDKEYSSDAAGIQEAAKDLSERRQSEPELIERNYVKTGPDAGERVEPNKSLPFDRAVSDLSKQRQAEIVSEMQKRADALAAEVDAVRQGNIGPDSADNIEQAKAQAEAALAAYQAEAAPAVDSRLDPEVQQALQNPKVAQALAAEIQQVEVAKRQFEAQAQEAAAKYSQAAFDAARVSAAAVLAHYPELQGVNPAEIGLAVQLIAKQSPEGAQRAAQITQELTKVEQLYRQHESAQQQINAHRQQQETKAFEAFTSAHDAAFEQSIKGEPPEVVKQIKSEILNIAKEHYGIDPKQFAELYRTQPIMRTAPMQRMMFDAARYQLAQKTATQNPASRTAPLPPVQRPGTSYRSSGDNSTVESARQKFMKNPDLASAREFLVARRKASQ